MQSNEPTINQMNAVISIFDGWKIFNGDTNVLCPSCDTGAIPSGWCICDQKSDRFQKDGKMVSVTYFQYHTSWDWLMPVIEKISKIPLLNADDTICTDPQDVCYPRTFGMPTEDGKSVMVRFNAAICQEAPTLLEAAYMAVYNFIKFENS
jgi:hypothetical protein